MVEALRKCAEDGKKSGIMMALQNHADFIQTAEDDPALLRMVDSYSIEALMDCAERASRKSAAWCRQASQETLDRFGRLHDPPVFGANFKAFLDRLGL